MGFVLIIAGLQFLSNIADYRVRETNPGYDEKIQMNSVKEKILHYAGFAAGLSCYAAFILTERIYDNTIGGARFAMESIFAGLGVAVIYYYTLKWYAPRFVIINEKRLSSILFTCLAFIAWTVFLIGRYNKLTVFNNEEIPAVAVKKTSSKNNDYLILTVCGKNERFKPSRDERMTVEPGDTVLLETGMGKMDYRYVFHFRKPGR